MERERRFLIILCADPGCCLSLRYLALTIFNIWLNSLLLISFTASDYLLLFDLQCSPLLCGCAHVYNAFALAVPGLLPILPQLIKLILRRTSVLNVTVHVYCIIETRARRFQQVVQCVRRYRLPTSLSDEALNSAVYADGCRGECGTVLQSAGLLQ